MFDRSTNTAFLNAILASPDDDAPRLIYADWLDEQGDEVRAEFIRTQIRLRELPPHAPERLAMASRVGELQQQHGIAWLADYPQHAGVHWEVWDRGFISGVRFENPDLFRFWADEVFHAAPITELRLHMFYLPDAERLAESPWLRNIRILDLEDGNHVGNLGIDALMQSPHLRNLRELKLRNNSLGSPAARAIASSPHVQQLEVLDLQRNDLYDEGLKALGRSPYLGNLRRLDLDRTRASSVGIAQLAVSPVLRKLTWLALSGNDHLGDEGAKALAASKMLQTVRHLFLQANQIGPVGITALANSPYLSVLEHLFIRQNRLRDAGVDALIQSPLVATLGQLYVGDNGITDEGADRLRRAFGNRVIVH